MTVQRSAQKRQSLDVALDLLADRYRRSLLVALLEHNPQNDDDTQIPAEVTVEDEDLEFLQIQIIHTHLPKLESAGVIVWDRESNEISKGPQFNELLPLLQLMYNHADDLPADWL